MPYYITKTGLDAFDTARAWGLGTTINVITGDEVRITDSYWAYIVEPASAVSANPNLAGNTGWETLFEDGNWQRVFLTVKGDWSSKRDKARNTLQQQIATILCDLQNPTNIVPFGTGESLPGGLDPTGFKGLRHTTRAQYQEGQLKVRKDHWALACLGMARCGTYRDAKEAGQSNWLALLPVPQNIHFSYFRDVQELFRVPGLKYHGVQNAAAHYAVQLAERLRRRAAAQGDLQDRYSAVLYFRLFGARQQIKPAQGNQLRLEPLMKAIAQDPDKTQPMLQWLDYCFRLGSTTGAEDLTLAATELVMRWDLDTYDRLVRTMIRYQKHIKRENLPDTKTLEKVISYVSIS
ncbi:MAG: hypothetical protein N0A24_08870 [Armatimonadetes bacterium]|nr:hypothetical protein [Armatimonadota bacterium]MDW8154301.1 hypothetical protein [Armatimonadota bacterium]